MLSKYYCWIRDTTKARECLLKLNGQAMWDTSLLIFLYSLSTSWKCQSFSLYFKNFSVFYTVTAFTHELHLKISDARLFAGMQRALCRLFLHGRKKLWWRQVDTRDFDCPWRHFHPMYSQAVGDTVQSPSLQVNKIRLDQTLSNQSDLRAGLDMFERLD